MVDIISRGENFILIFLRVLVINFVRLIVNRICDTEMNAPDINTI